MRQTLVETTRSTKYYKRFALNKNESFVNVPSEWTADMDTICSRCGIRFGNHFGLDCPDQKGVFSKRVRKPLKSAVVARSASTNSSYTAALRDKCRKYFKGADSVAINNFIKSVQRLNASKAKHCV